jgi:ribosomal protein L9
MLSSVEQEKLILEKKEAQRLRAMERKRNHRARLKALGLRPKRSTSPEQVARDRDSCRRWREKNREKIRIKERERLAAHRRARGIPARNILSPEDKARAEKAQKAKQRKAEKAREARRMEAEAKRIEKLEAKAAKGDCAIKIVRKFSRNEKPVRSVMSLWTAPYVPEWLKVKIALAEAQDAAIDATGDTFDTKKRQEIGPTRLEGLVVAGRTDDLFPIYADIVPPSRKDALPKWGGKVRCSLKASLDALAGGKSVFLPTYERFWPKGIYPYSYVSYRMQINGINGTMVWLTEKKPKPVKAANKVKVITEEVRAT